MDAYLLGFATDRQRRIAQYFRGAVDAPPDPPIEWLDGTPSGSRLYWAAKARSEEFVDDFLNEEHSQRAGRHAALFHGLPGWERMRALIWVRDKGVCFVCRRRIDIDEYELGHLHDRCAGGLDIPENLVVMCVFCNRVIKPVHESTEEARQWAGHSSVRAVGSMRAPPDERRSEGAA